MDSLKAHKLQAKKSTNQFLYNFLLHSLTALACTLICAYSNWFHSIKHFSFISLPYIWSSFFNNPKCLFIIVNVIVVFLVGESKLVGSNSSPAGELYDEYVERTQSLRRSASSSTTTQEKTEERKEENDHDQECVVNKVEDKEVIKEEVEEEEERRVEEILLEEEDCGDEEKETEGEEEENGLPAEELNKRVEEFIARVNKKRWLEERLLVCCRA